METYENGKIQCGSVSDFRFLTNWAQINQGYRICKLSTCTLLPSIFMTSSMIKNENWFWVQDQLYQSSNVLICRMSNQKDHLVFKQRNYFVVKKTKKTKKNVLIKWITKSSDDKNKVGHSRIGEGLRVRLSVMTLRDLLFQNGAISLRMCLLFYRRFSTGYWCSNKSCCLEVANIWRSMYFK